MDSETREALAELKDGVNNLAALMAQLAQLICYAEGIPMPEPDDEDEPHGLRN